MRPPLIALALLAASGLVESQASFETADPLKAFVYEEYARGGDYFAHGTRDTTLFRCQADFDRDGRPDIALSEVSTWGNRTGSFEVFVRVQNDRFRYARTADYDVELKAKCARLIESCSSKEYVATGTCHWQRGMVR